MLKSCACHQFRPSGRVIVGSLLLSSNDPGRFDHAGQGFVGLGGSLLRKNWVAPFLRRACSRDMRTLSNSEQVRFFDLIPVFDADFSKMPFQSGGSSSSSAAAAPTAPKQPSPKPRWTSGSKLCTGAAFRRTLCGGDPVFTQQ